MVVVGGCGLRLRCELSRDDRARYIPISLDVDVIRSCADSSWDLAFPIDCGLRVGAYILLLSALASCFWVAHVIIECRMIAHWLFSPTSRVVDEVTMMLKCVTRIYVFVVVAMSGSVVFICIMIHLKTQGHWQEWELMENIFALQVVCLMVHATVLTFFYVYWLRAWVSTATARACDAAQFGRDVSRDVTNPSVDGSIRVAVGVPLSRVAQTVYRVD